MQYICKRSSKPSTASSKYFRERPPSLANSLNKGVMVYIRVFVGDNSILLGQDDNHLLATPFSRLPSSGEFRTSIVPYQGSFQMAIGVCICNIPYSNTSIIASFDQWQGFWHAYFQPSLPKVNRMLAWRQTGASTERLRAKSILNIRSPFPKK